MDLAKELAALKLQVETETQTRKILEDWINSSLKATLERHHAELKTLKTVYESKISALETRLEQEILNRKKLNAWIKEYLGPELDSPVLKETVERISSIKKSRSSSVGSADVRPLPQTSKAPSSLTTKRVVSKKKPTETAAEDSPWSDESDHDESSSRFSKALPQPSTISKTNATTSSSVSNTGKPSYGKIYTSSSSSSSSAKPNPPLSTRIQKLSVLESQCFGTDEVTDSTFPTGDATIKTSLNRMNYYLIQQKQAATNYMTPNLLDQVQLFLKKGPTVVFAPLHEADAKKDSFSFAIKTHDRLFPICPDGLVRSQVLYLVLQGIKRKLGVSQGLELPHGARFGFDPFPQQDLPNDPQQQFQHLPSPKSGKDLIAFQNAFGVDRVMRFGQDTATNQVFSFDPSKKYSDAEKAAISAQRKRMREYFDLYYYGGFKSQSSNSSSTGSRIVLIVFGSALPIVMDRLAEVNYRFDLSKITILALPYNAEKLMGDTRSEDYIAAYKLYASLFKPILE